MELALTGAFATLWRQAKRISWWNNDHTAWTLRFVRVPALGRSGESAWMGDDAIWQPPD